MKVSGGCLCGQIRFDVNMDTFLTLRCHCRDCQYLSGGEPAAVVAVAADSVRVAQGAPGVFRSSADSGSWSISIVLRELWNSIVCRH